MPRASSATTATTTAAATADADAAADADAEPPPLASRMMATLELEANGAAAVPALPAPTETLVALLASFKRRLRL